MKYLESNTIENYNITHHIERFTCRKGEVILLLPRNKSLNTLIGVNRVPFLEFMSIPYSVTSYDFFECDMDINYRFTNNTVVITNREQIQNRLMEFAEMVYDIFKSVGTESKYKSQLNQQNIDLAIRHKDCVDDETQTPFKSECITLGKVLGTSNNYEIFIGNKTIFQCKNKTAVNKIWSVLISVLNIFKVNILKRL